MKLNQWQIYDLMRIALVSAAVRAVVESENTHEGHIQMALSILKQVTKDERD